MFNADWSGIDHFGIQNMATVPNSKKGLFGHDLIDSNGFDEFRNVYYSGAVQTTDIAYNSLINEYEQKASNIPTNGQENTPHIAHNADKIARLNQMIALELNGEGELKRWGQMDLKQGVVDQRKFK
uniref:Uncharacterized protein n=1 Tax=Cacopsylla melanoneura TaxID=428564 RepID=A0A8D9FEN3_9HEMI